MGKAAAGRPRVGAWLRRALRRRGHDKSCPYLGSPCGERRPWQWPPYPRQVSAVGGWEHRRAKGNRRPEEWLGAFLSGLRSRPSGAWFGCSGSGAGSVNQTSVLSRRLSHRSISGGRWQLRVAGGGLSHSVLHPALRAVLNSVLNSAPLCRDAVPTLPAAN